MKQLKVILVSFILFGFLGCKNPNVSKRVDDSNSSENITKEVKNVKEVKSVEINHSSSNFQFTGEAKGCESFTLFKLSADKTMGIRISGEREILKLSQTAQKFSFGKDQIYASVYQFNGSAENYFCDDIADVNLKKINKWDATEGVVSALITQDDISTSGTDIMYKMTLIIESVILKNKKNETVELKNVVFKDVLVGWYAG